MTRDSNASLLLPGNGQLTRVPINIEAERVVTSGRAGDLWMTELRVTSGCSSGSDEMRVLLWGDL